MSMSTHIVGFRPPDEKFKKMKAIYDKCVDAEVDVPDAVDRFFNGEPPDDAGVEVRLSETGKNPCLTEWQDDSAQGYEVDLTKLPPDVKVIRFYNSW